MEQAAGGGGRKVAKLTEPAKPIKITALIKGFTKGLTDTLMDSVLSQ
jgi:hypothetical protein